MLHLTHAFGAIGGTTIDAVGLVLAAFVKLAPPKRQGFFLRVSGLGRIHAPRGTPGDAVGKLVDVYLPRDLQMASDAGKARFPSVRTARDLVVGA